MAKESMKAREVKRAKLAKRYQHKRDEIAAKVKSGEMDHEEACRTYQKLERNQSCRIPEPYDRIYLPVIQSDFL